MTTLGEPSTAEPNGTAHEHQSSSPDSHGHVDGAKMVEIIDACRRRDIGNLQALAESRGGFISDRLRQQAWPVLLGMPSRPPREEDEKHADFEHGATHPFVPEHVDNSWKNLAPHAEEEQVKLDVARAFVYYPNCESDEELSHHKEELLDLILSVLRRHSYLSYFQGYHDICQVFLLVLPPSLRSLAVARLSIHRIRDFMLPNFSAAIAQLQLIPDILITADPTLWHHLSQTEPFFALSGTLTMYAHDVQSLSEITRLFDILLAREPVFSLYMFAQIVLNRRAELFDTPSIEPEILHSILSKLPQPLELEELVTDTARLMDKYPPETLRTWKRMISPHSVLKTARSIHACAGQSLQVGAYYFERQVLELQRAERRDRVVQVLRRCRRPAATAGLAILIGVLAYWMRKSPASFTVASPFGYITAVLSQWWKKS